MAQNEEAAPPDYKAPLGKLPTPLQRRFADWLMGEEVGYSPATAKTKEEAFREGVRLAVALRIPYQASDANKTATMEERALRAKEKAADDANKAQNKSNRAAQRAAATEPTPEAEPAKPAKRGAKKAAPAANTPPPASTRPPARRAPARRAPAAGAKPAAEAPF